LGIGTYLARYLPQYSEVMAPIRQLLSRDTEFRWDDMMHGVAFQRLKNML
jgi:hypothetical protein